MQILLMPVTAIILILAATDPYRPSSRLKTTNPQHGSRQPTQLAAPYDFTPGRLATNQTTFTDSSGLPPITASQITTTSNTTIITYPLAVNIYAALLHAYGPPTTHAIGKPAWCSPSLTITLDRSSLQPTLTLTKPESRSIP